MQKKQTMHHILLRDLKFLRYWWSCLTCSVTFCWLALHETLILCLYRNGQLFEYNHFKIISHYCFYINSSFILSYYIYHPKYVRHIFFINRILGSITSDIMNTVTLSTWQYVPNTLNYNTTRLKNVKNQLTVGWYQKYLPTFCQNAPKFSPELWHFSPQVQKRYDYVTKRTNKSIKYQFLFSNRG